MKPLRQLLFALVTFLLAAQSQAEQATSGYLGMGVDTVPESIKAHFPDEIADAQGLLVTQFADKSPAADDGIKLFDVLIAYDDQPIADPEAFILKVRNDQSDRLVKFKLLRQGKVLTIPVTMGKQKTIKEVAPVTYTPTVRGQAMPPAYAPQRQMPAFNARPTTQPRIQGMPPNSSYPARGFTPYGRYPVPQRPMAYQAPNVNYPRVPAVNRNPYTAAPYATRPTQPPLNNAMTLNKNGRPVYPMQRKRVKEKHAWGDKRNIWDDFYTDFTGDLWDKMVNAPFDVGRMPGGWRAPSLSTPDPVTIGDAVTNQLPPMAEEMGNMADFSN